MRARILFAVVMTVLLVAGTAASTACEMTCLPQAQAGACCPQHAQQLMQHCEHAAAASLASSHQCEHPQDSAAVSTVNVVSAPLAADVVVPIADITSNDSSLSLMHDSLSSLRLKPSSLTPLRI